MSGLRELFREVQHRSITTALGAYLAAAWLVFELVQQIADSADQPWLPDVALVLLLIGLPVVVGTAFLRDRPPGNASGTSDQVSSSPTTRVARTPGDASVVVLPLDNIGGREEVAYLSQGITEQITSQLAKVSELKVISRTSAETVTGYNLTIPEIADRLGVEHVVEGSVQLFGEQIRVTAQLIHAESDEHLWADSYDGQLQDLFALQEDIAIQIASALTSAVGGVRGISSVLRTENPEAYEAYLIGKSHLHTRSREGMLRAIKSFEQSIAEDPNYAPAYAGLAMTYGLFVTYGHPEVTGYELYGRGIGMANRAIELDQDAAEAYAARGFLGLRDLGPAGPVAADLQRALELSPNSADAHGWYAHLLIREGQYDEGFAHVDTALEIDPLAPGRRMGTAMNGLTARRYDVVIRQAQGAVALQPSVAVSRFYEGLAYLLTRRFDDCLKVLGDSFPGLRAMCEHSRGSHIEATQIVDSLKSALGPTSQPGSQAEMALYRDLAMFYAWVGNVAETLSWLEPAFAWSHNAVQFEVMKCGIFDRVSDDPDFHSGLERIHSRARARLLQEVDR